MTSSDDACCEIEATFPILSAFPTTPTTFPGVWFFRTILRSPRRRATGLDDLLANPVAEEVN